MGEPADLDRAAQRIVTVKTMNAGQICLAPDYVFVRAGKEEAFVKAATAAVTAMFPTLKENPDYTSVINQRHFERLTGLLDDAREKGAQIAAINPASEDLSDRSAHRLAPTLVLSVTDKMRILHEEIFGPLLPIVSYTSIEEALSRVNARPRPLALYYFGNSPEEERRVLDGTTSGAADLNSIKLPGSVDTLTAAALGCRFMTAYRAAVSRGRVRPGEWIGVHGCGGVGLSAVKIAAAADALVVAVDVDDHKLAKAREERAAATVNARGLTPEQVGQAVGPGSCSRVDPNVPMGIHADQIWERLVPAGCHRPR